MTRRPSQSQRFDHIRSWWKRAERPAREKYLAQISGEHPPHWAGLSFGRLQGAIFDRAVKRGAPGIAVPRAPRPV